MIRGLIQQTFLLVLVAIVVPIASIFGNKNAPKTPEELEKEAEDRAKEAENFTEPSAWIEPLAELAHYMYIIAGPGIFVSQKLKSHEAGQYKTTS